MQEKLSEITHTPRARTNARLTVLDIKGKHSLPLHLPLHIPLPVPSVFPASLELVLLAPFLILAEKLYSHSAFAVKINKTNSPTPPPPPVPLQHLLLLLLVVPSFNWHSLWEPESLCSCCCLPGTGVCWLFCLLFWLCRGRGGGWGQGQELRGHLATCSANSSRFFNFVDCLPRYSLFVVMMKTRTGRRSKRDRARECERERERKWVRACCNLNKRISRRIRTKQSWDTL